MDCGHLICILFPWQHFEIKFSCSNKGFPVSWFKCWTKSKPHNLQNFLCSILLSLTYSNWFAGTFHTLKKLYTINITISTWQRSTWRSGLLRRRETPTPQKKRLWELDLLGKFSTSKTIWAILEKQCFGMNVRWFNRCSTKLYCSFFEIFISSYHFIYS